MSKVKIDINKLKTIFQKIVPLFNREAADKLGAEIDGAIGKGVSPVRGQGRFQNYKESYQDAIKAGYQGGGKRVRPVNLMVTGKLRNSQNTKITNMKVIVTYTDEKAAYHNEGNGKMPRRAILPTKPGEEFSPAITKFLKGLAKKSIDAVL